MSLTDTQVDTEVPTATSNFVFAKETKNTRKYDEVPPAGQAPIIGSLYLQKHVAHQLGNPDAVTVVVAPLP